MAKNEIPANDYRAERKKRLAKEAKKSSKKSLDSVKVVTWIIGFIIAIAIIAFGAFSLFQFEVPHKLLPAVKVDGKTYTVAEYGFYYTSVFNSYAEQSNQMSQQYGYSTFDYTKDPSMQNTTDEDGNTITYDELFKKAALKNMETSKYYLDICKEENIELSEENAQAIDKLISDIEGYASSNNVSVSRYISLIYGKGLSESKFRELLTEQYLVAQYIEGIESECYDNISDEKLEEEYAKDPSAYQAVDLRLFGFEIKDEETSTETTTNTNEEATEETSEVEETSSEETTEAIAEETTINEETTANETSDETTSEAGEATTEETTTEKSEAVIKTEQLAQEMLDKIEDEDSFVKLALEYAAEADKETFKNNTATLAKGIKKSVVSTNIGEDLAEWLYDDAREVGEKRMFTTDDYVYVIYILKTCYRNDEPLVDARHILVSFENVAKALSETEGNKIDTNKNEDVDVETAKTEEDIEITNKGTGYSIELVTEAYKTARNIYDEYMKGEKTEEAFAALAEQNSADTGSIGENGSGGLYESIERGKMVEAFENWVYDKDRKPGDVDVIMTEYGWHVMYFVKQHDEAAWRADVRNSIGQAEFEEISKEVEENISGTAVGQTFLSFAGKQACKNVAKLYANAGNN